jgi:hypothetical protein
MGQSTLSNQRQLPGTACGAVQPIRKVEDALVRSCDTLLDAIHLCIHLSKRKHYDIAEALGIDKGHWTRIMQGGAHFPTNKLRALQYVCGNWAPLQYQTWEAGFEMYENPKAKREAELLAELASIRGGGPSTGVHENEALARAA